MHELIKASIQKQIVNSIQRNDTTAGTNKYKIMIMDRVLIGGISQNSDAKLLQSEGVELFYEFQGLGTKMVAFKKELVSKLMLKGVKKSVAEMEQMDITIYYYLHPTTTNIELLDSIVQNNLKYNHIVHFIPYCDSLSLTIIREKRLDQHATIRDLALFLFPSDKRLLTMSSSDTFLNEPHYGTSYISSQINSILDDSVVHNKNLYFNPGLLFNAALALHSLIVEFGTPTHIVSFGSNAMKIADLLKTFRHENNTAVDGYSNIQERISSITPTPNNIFKNINANRTIIKEIIIIDRNFDLISPLLTSQTYEGILDELFTIHKNGNLKVKSNLLNAGPNKKEHVVGPPKLISIDCVNGNDYIFDQLRDINFQQIPKQLSQLTSEAKSMYNQSVDSKDKSIAELKEIVTNIPKLQSRHSQLNDHFMLAELINAAIIMSDTKIQLHPELYAAIKPSLQICKSMNLEHDFIHGVDLDKVSSDIVSMVYEKTSIYNVLKLVCLQSQLASGLKHGVIAKYISLITRNYGCEHLKLIHKLHATGLLLDKSSSVKNTSEIISKMKLINHDQVNIHSTAQVYSGFSPISCSFIDHYLSHQKDITTTSQLVKTYGESFRIDENDLNESMANIESKKTIVLFYFGGITRAELSALEIIRKRVVCNDRLGKKVRVKCNGDDTIGDLKLLVAAQIGTDSSKIVFKKWNSIYKDHITLSDYEVHDGMNLEMYYQ